MASPLNPAVLDLQNPKNSARNDEPRTTRRYGDHQHHFTCSHAPIRASHASPWCLMRSHAPLQLYDIIMTSLPTFSLTRFLGPNPNRWPGPNYLRKKCFDQVWPLTLTKKSKISKKGLSHSIFRVHSNFGIRFFVQDFEIVQTVRFPKSWLSHKSWPKSQNFQEWLVLPNFSCRFRFWGLFLLSRIWNYSNSMILQLLALRWTLSKNQDVRAKLVLFRFSHRLWLWNPLICFGLGNHLCDTLLRSTSSIQNLSFQDQNLRFIHLVWIPSGLFPRLYQGFPSKVQMNSYKCILNLKLHWVTSSTYHSRSVPTDLQPTIPHSVPNILAYSSVPTSQESTILTKNSQPPFSTTHLPFFVSPL